MAKPNYRQQKTRKEAARKLRQAEKLRRRTGTVEDSEPGTIEATPSSSGAAPPPTGAAPSEAASVRADATPGK